MGITAEYLDIVGGSSLAALREYGTARESSYDRSGANADWKLIPRGTVVQLGEIQGPGIITHLWIPFGVSGDHVRHEVLRIYWDGEREPSVEVPLQDFFGLALGEQVNHQSALLSAAPWNGLNAYFPMPFARSARITLHNEDKRDLHIYCNIDYVKLAKPLEGAGYFHAQYRQHAAAGASNQDESEHVIFEAKGRGHLVGLSRGIVAGSGSEMHGARECLYLDGSDPLIDGWFRSGATTELPPGGSDFTLPYNFELEGKTEAVAAVSPAGRYQSYRWFVEGPPTFRQQAKGVIKATNGKSLGSEVYTVAYWYQTEPHQAFPRLPAPEDRVPRPLANNRQAPVFAKDFTPVTG